MQRKILTCWYLSEVDNAKDKLVFYARNLRKNDATVVRMCNSIQGIRL
jgi:hypothetical protein